MLTPQHLPRSTPLPWSPPFWEFRPAPLHLETPKISLVPLPTCGLSRSCIRGLYASKPPSPFTPEASDWFSASTLGPLWCIFGARVKSDTVKHDSDPGANSCFKTPQQHRLLRKTNSCSSPWPVGLLPSPGSLCGQPSVLCSASPTLPGLSVPSSFLSLGSGISAPSAWTILPQSQ